MLQRVRESLHREGLMPITSDVEQISQSRTTITLLWRYRTGSALGDARDGRLTANVEEQRDTVFVAIAEVIGQGEQYVHLVSGGRTWEREAVIATSDHFRRVHVVIRFRVAGGGHLSPLPPLEPDITKNVHDDRSQCDA